MLQAAWVERVAGVATALPVAWRPEAAQVQTPMLADPLRMPEAQAPQAARLAQQAAPKAEAQEQPTVARVATAA